MFEKKRWSSKYGSTSITTNVPTARSAAGRRPRLDKAGTIKDIIDERLTA
jgi:hypothetical protein